MRTPTLLVLGLCGLLSLTAFAEDETVPGPLERALLSPPADGLLVISTSARGQAHQLGVQPGDVLVSVAGHDVRSPEDLQAAMGSGEAAGAVEAVFVRGGERLTLAFPRGALGIDARPVMKGEAPAPLPPATVTAVDPGRADEPPTEVWYAFTLAPHGRVGFVHLTRERRGKQIALSYERAFDAGDDAGSAHHRIVVVMDAELTPLVSHFENVDNGWTGEGRRGPAMGGGTLWEVTWPPQGGPPVIRHIRFPTDLPVLPRLEQGDAAARLPREVGACLHYRPLHEGLGSIEMPCALHAAGKETIEVDGEARETWRVDRHQLGSGVVQSWWFENDGPAVRIVSGSVTWDRCTKAEAVAGLPDGVAPTTGRREATGD